MRTRLVVLLLLSCANSALTGCGQTGATTTAATATAAEEPTVTAGPTPTDTNTDRIAFVGNSLDNGNDIFLMDADGGNIVQLTHRHGFPSEVAWSPDGTQIAFGSVGNGGLNVINSDGTGFRQVTSGMYNYDNPAWSPDGKHIVFSAKNLIFVVNADGSRLTQLTHTSHEDYSPTWSPDGTQIAFTSRRDNNSEIYIMHADGSDQTNLTHSAEDENNASWSPDGRLIAYADISGDGAYVMDIDGTHRRLVSDKAGGAFGPTLRWSPYSERLLVGCVFGGGDHICSVKLDGSDFRQLTLDPNRSDHGGAWQPNPAVTLAAAVSPRPIQTDTPTTTPTPIVLALPGKQGRIAFASRQDGDDEIYLMNPDGTGVVQLTYNYEQDYEPNWSPDGQRIVFVSARDGNDELYIMDANGSNQTRMTDTAEDEFHPIWSPDGRQIMFSADCNCASKVYVMNADGSNRVNLTNNEWTNFVGSWSPDGSQIVLSSNREGSAANTESPFAIYIMNADGSQVVKITREGAVGGVDPVWSPNGMAILFTHFLDERNSDLYVMQRDGTGVVKLSSGGLNYSATWSPDGSLIAFVKEALDGPGLPEIVVMNSDGRNQKQITTEWGQDPSWSPAP